MLWPILCRSGQVKTKAGQGGQEGLKAWASQSAKSSTILTEKLRLANCLTNGCIHGASSVLLPFFTVP